MPHPAAKIDTDPAHRRAQSVRFWACVDVRGPDDCWLWNRSTKGRPYGAFTMVVNDIRMVVSPSRFSCWLHHGPPSALGHAQHSRHLCPDKRCVNPRHVVWGTPRENALDNVKEKKGAWYNGLRRRYMRDLAWVVICARRNAVAYPQPVRTRTMPGWGITWRYSGARESAADRAARVEMYRARADALTGGRRDLSGRWDALLGRSTCSLFNNDPPPSSIPPAHREPLGATHETKNAARRIKYAVATYGQELFDARPEIFMTHSGQTAL